MKKQLFPIEIVENSTEKLIKKNSVKTHLIYNIVILAVVVAMVLTMVISVDINITTPGTIKTPGERLMINSPYGAFVERVCVRENSKVCKGDTILVLNTEQFDNELSKNGHRLGEVAAYIKDLSVLVLTKKDDVNVSVNLISPLYRQSYSYYMSQYIDLNNRVGNMRNNYNRSKTLLRNGDISASEFEPVEAEFSNQGFAINLFYDRQISQWQTDLDKYITEERELRAQIEQTTIRKEESVVVSPIAGIIQKIEGVNKGSYVQQGQKLIEISVDSILLVECMMQPKDIGYVRIGQELRMQVDAYNYNEWGLARGQVIDIFDDVTIVNTSGGSVSYFKVLCSINTPYLELKNGYQGELKRGMTVNARFKITRRTLFQLLYDKVDDWMNPNIASVS